MTSEDVRAIVARGLATSRPPVVEPGTTIGLPWKAERYRPEIARLRAALVVEPGKLALAGELCVRLYPLLRLP